MARPGFMPGQLAVLRSQLPRSQADRAHGGAGAAAPQALRRLIAERRVRPTVLQPLWNVAGFALGAATALMSEKAALACTDAVETEIDRHYGAQLDELGDDDPELAADIAEFRAEELEHRDTARAAGATEARRLSSLDCGDPCRLQGGDRAFEAYLRNRTRVRPLQPLERTKTMTRLMITLAGALHWPAALPPCRRPRPRRPATRSARSLSTAPIRARARPTIRSWSARASRRAERYRIPEKLRNERPAPDRREAWANKARRVRDGRLDRDLQLLAGRPGRLHRLPDPGHQAGQARTARAERAGHVPTSKMQSGLSPPHALIAKATQPGRAAIMSTAAVALGTPAAPDDRAFLGHPRGLAYLAFTEAWERFSYYGMTALLVAVHGQPAAAAGPRRACRLASARSAHLFEARGPMSNSRLRLADLRLVRRASSISRRCSAG